MIILDLLDDILRFINQYFLVFESVFIALTIVEVILVFSLVVGLNSVEVDSSQYREY